MYDSIEVQVQVVHFISIRVGLCGVHWNLDAIDLPWLLFNHRVDDLGILLREPAEKRWNTHDGGANVERKSILCADRSCKGETKQRERSPTAYEKGPRARAQAERYIIASLLKSDEFFKVTAGWWRGMMKCESRERS